MIKSSAAPASGPHLRCQVWSAGLSLLRPEHLDLLDATEHARRDGYLRAGDRDRFTLGAALLRLAAARTLGVAAGQVPVDRICATCGAPHGKPRVAGADLHLSVSHSGERVLLAVTTAAAVGVDLELVTARDVAALERLVLAPGERADAPGDFYRYWCRKESVVKATGDGLRVGLTEVVVSPPDRPAAVESYRGSALPSAMTDLEVGPGYAAALTVLAAGVLEAEVRDAAPLLADG